MIIRNLEKNYAVIRACEGAGDTEQYLCQDAEGKEKLEYKIARIPLDKVEGRLVFFLAAQLKRDDFLDLADYFTDDGYLYAVMRLGLGIPVNQKLAEENCSLAERFRIAERIITSLVLLNPHPYFFQAAMDAERIRVSSTGDVYFDYDLSELQAYSRVVFADGMKGLAKVLKVLFARELELLALPGIARLIYDLEQGEFREFLEIHERFLPVYEEWLGKTDEDLQPETWSFRLWERCKKLFGLAKKLVYVGILLLALAYLVISVRAFRQEPGVRQNFQKVGTLEIRGAEETTGAEETSGAEKTAEENTEHKE